jgi:hypothetical protein
MSITSAFIEIVVIGVQGLVWVSLLAASVFGFDTIKTIQLALNESPGSLTAIMLLSVIYTLGVLIDRIGDGLFVLVKPREVLLRITSFQRWADRAHADQRLPVFLNEGKASSILEYIRSRVRILRSSFFNFVMIMLSSALLVHTRLDNMTLTKRFRLTIFIVLMGAVVLILVFVCWGMLEITYDRRLAQANQTLQEARNNKEQRG